MRAAPPSGLVGLALLAWTAAVRLPFAGTLGPDEAFFAIVGRRWLGGIAPYIGSFDVKPPGLFAAFAAAVAMFGGGIAAIKALELAAVAATAFALWLIGARHLSWRVGAFAAVLYPVYSLALMGATMPTELLEASGEGFAALAVLEALRRGGQLRAVAAAGMLLGAAGTIKQTAAFPALALLVVLLWRWPGRRVAPLLVFGIAMAVAPGAFLLWYWAIGGVPALLEGAVLGAAGRLSGDDLGFVTGLLNFLPSMKPLIILQCAALFFVTRGLRLRGGAMEAGAAVSAAWLAGAVAALVAMRSMYPYYFLALVPPLLLAAGIAVFDLLGPAGAWRGRIALAVGALALVWPVAVDKRGIAPGEDVAAEAETARRIAALGLPPDATLLVINRGMPIYLFSKLRIGTRYFHTQHLMCDFPAPVADPLEVALAARPTVLVMADRSFGMLCERADRRAEAAAAIAASYCHAGHVAGESDSFDIFVRRGGGARC